MEYNLATRLIKQYTEQGKMHSLCSFLFSHIDEMLRLPSSLIQ